MFDSSVARGNPSTFTLSRVMAGWRECVQLMVVGEKRRCWVPQALAYKGQAGRPAGTVVFDIELVDTRPSPTIPPPDVARDRPTTPSAPRPGWPTRCCGRASASVIRTACAR